MYLLHVPWRLSGSPRVIPETYAVFDKSKFPSSLVIGIFKIGFINFENVIFILHFAYTLKKPLQFVDG